MAQLSGQTVEEQEYPNPVFALQQDPFQEFRKALKSHLDSIFTGFRKHQGRLSLFDYAALRFVDRDVKASIIETVEDLARVSGESPKELKYFLIAKMRELFNMQIVDAEGKPNIPEPEEARNHFILYSPDTTSPKISQFDLGIIRQVLSDTDQVQSLAFAIHLKGDGSVIQPRDLIRKIVDSFVRRRSEEEINNAVSDEITSNFSLENKMSLLVNRISRPKGPLLEVFESSYGKSDILRALLLCHQLIR